LEASVQLMATDNHNHKVVISTVPTKAKSWGPWQALIHRHLTNKIWYYNQLIMGQDPESQAVSQSDSFGAIYIYIQYHTIWWMMFGVEMAREVLGKRMNQD